MAPTRTLVARARRATVPTVVALAALIGLAVPGGPAHAISHPWGTYPGANADDLTAQGVAPRITAIGDSLIYNIGVPAESFGDNLRAVTGRRTHTRAVAGASSVNFGWPGQQNGWPLMWDMADADNSRLTIAALATNDARIMTTDPTYYDQQKQYDMMANAVAVTRQHSHCVMLVTTRERTVTNFSATKADQVNDNMLWLSAVFSGGRVHVADWDAYSAANNPSNSWYEPDDVHHTPTGELKYAAFIAAQAKSLITTKGC